MCKSRSNETHLLVMLRYDVAFRFRLQRYAPGRWSSRLYHTVAGQGVWMEANGWMDGWIDGWMDRWMDG